MFETKRTPAPSQHDKTRFTFRTLWLHCTCSPYVVPDSLNHRQTRRAGSLIQHTAELRFSSIMGRSRRVKLLWKVFFFFVTSTYSPSSCIIVVLTKEPHSAPAALMKKSSQSYFTGGGLLHAYVKRKPCCNGRRSRFKSFQVQIRCIKSMGGGGRKTRLFLKGLFQTLNVTLGMWTSQVFHLKSCSPGKNNNFPSLLRLLFYPHVFKWRVEPLKWNRKKRNSNYQIKWAFFGGTMQLRSSFVKEEENWNKCTLYMGHKVGLCQY